MRSVLVIGCGAVGASLARAIAGSAGHRVTGVHDAAAGRAAPVAAALGAEAIADLSDEASALADLVLVAVPGRAIRAVAEAAARAPVRRGHQIWLHCDGREPTVALGALEGSVRGCGTMHPAHAFPPGAISPLRAGCGFAVSGDADAVAAAELLARDLGGFAVRIPDAARDAYHAAAVLASNCAVALLAVARGVLADHGIDPADAERLLLTLASSAIGAGEGRGLEAALSGPIRRGDAEAVRRHVAALAGSKDALEIYRILGRATLAVARSAPGYPAAAAAEIARALDCHEER
jgi:predicted short-subunit dehydrogenase-like oxidoreductase (DUF2520 family)